MKIVNLIDNIEGTAGCPAEHGLSYYVETEKHKLLIDAGASGLAAENAVRLGVDLRKVDTVILSHGHYDHGGGLLKFFEINDHAPVWMQKEAFGEYYAMHEEGLRYIGLPKEMKGSGRILFADGDRKIDDELSLFASIRYFDPVETGPESPKVLEEEELVQDEYRHEQCLLVTQGEKKFLFSGCAHHGILNIMKSFREKYSCDPDHVFSGFHLKKRNGYSEENIRSIRRIAEELKKYNTRFHTGHCTGEEPFRIMKEILGEQLEYIHCGDAVCL